ncbi:protein SEMI-ROLLED LEAF 2 isoform X2 [Amaranthus tricolor]|uniref:protein SEMI-ROLLED LEAF 2 isoform X2 n=1 Tax=Amaranthus tricolor TaxID=29722 RepID=UPI00258716BB|nr:protein SEMI-ROLLED LEAF 2 isoform X2 [Amaranthus tricolor]
MGVISRRVLPVCGSICIFCPSLRARSRQPVKRYKKLLTDIFPRNQEIEPNDRKIGKLSEYASKNSLRVPKISEYLEQRFYKDLRTENIGSAKVVVCVYRKFLSSCKEQMPLYASSLLAIIRTLLDQTSQEEMQILGCNVLVDFLNVQVESTYMFNIEGLVPKLCQLAQEVGDDDRSLCLRSAGLQALSSMVRFMGEQCHIPMEFDKIISATLDNFADAQVTLENGNHHVILCEQDRCSRLSINSDNNGSSTSNICKDSPSSVDILNIKQQLELPVNASKRPSYWSKVCLYNMAGLAKEATTVRRVLEPFFHRFDSEDYWSPERGLAASVLMFMQVVLEDSAEDNSHLLLSILVKHLDHKNVAKQPLKQISIIHVISQLAQYIKIQASVALTGALTDLLKHLRKCMQYSVEFSSTGSGGEKLNADLQLALEKCISQLSCKVGDGGPILDMMAVVLENVSNSNIVARTTIFSVYRTAQIISSLPNLSYHKKTFPDALFHQLLIVMGHPDSETRIGAHRVLSTVLMPSLIFPWLDQKELAVQSSLWPSSNLSALTTDSELTSLRLSSHQVSLLLSSIWVQATSIENMPSNFEAMAHTYNIALLLTRTKTSSHMALVRCFQLAFSLRSMSLDHEGGLQPSRRRSLFTMASCMLIFSARAGNLPELIPIVKSSLTNLTIDPYLELVEDIRLQAVIENTKAYGSEEDDLAALKSLTAIESDEHQLKKTVISHLMSKFAKLSEDELSGIEKQLLLGFSPDESYPLGGPLFMETPQPCSPLAQLNFQSADEVASAFFDDVVSDANGSQSGRKTSISSNSLDILNVNQLLESVLETAQQVASFPASTTIISYDQVKDQCEALVTGKHQKMSVLQSFKQQLESKAIVLSSDTEMKRPSLMDLELEPNVSSMGKELIHSHDKLYPCALEYGYQSFRLPPASPYDKFLKAAGC